MNDHPRAQRKLAQLEEELRELKDQAMKRFDEFVDPEVSRHLLKILFRLFDDCLRVLSTRLVQPPNQYQHLFDFHSLRKQQVYGSQAMRRAGERHARLIGDTSAGMSGF